MNQPLQNWYCDRCGHSNHPNWNACQMCRTPNPFIPAQVEHIKPKTNNAKAIGITLLVIAGFCGLSGIIGNLVNLDKSRTGTHNQGTSTASVLTGGSPLPPSSTPTPYPKGYTVSGKPELELIKSTWEKGGFGTVAMWRITVRNNTDKRIGDIKYETRYFSETGNQVDKGGELGLVDRTIQKVVEPKKTRTFEVNDGFTHNEAERANFDLKSWRVID